jgi:V/A-type H+-transporting ATPase subunit E
MSADNVVEKILADARAEAEKIAKQARDAQAAEDARHNEQLQEYTRQTHLLAEKAAHDEKSHLLSAARMQMAKDYLAEKTKILEEVFLQARRQVESLPDEQYRDLMTRLIGQAVQTGDEQVVIGRNENRINQDLVNQVNQRLGPAGKGGLKLSGERLNITGGFVLRRGKVKTNVSLDVLLDQARKELEIDLAKEIFTG